MGELWENIPQPSTAHFPCRLRCKHDFSPSHTLKATIISPMADKGTKKPSPPRRLGSDHQSKRIFSVHGQSKREHVVQEAPHEDMRAPLKGLGTRTRAILWGSHTRPCLGLTPGSCMQEPAWAWKNIRDAGRPVSSPLSHLCSAINKPPHDLGMRGPRTKVGPDTPSSQPVLAHSTGASVKHTVLYSISQQASTLRVTGLTAEGPNTSPSR